METTSAPSTTHGTPVIATPSTNPARAIAGLFVNLVVLPGLGTLISGNPKFRRLGWFQLSIGLVLVPSIAVLTQTGWTPGGMNSGMIREALGQFMIALAAWSGITSIMIIWQAWKQDRLASQARSRELY